ENRRRTRLGVAGGAMRPKPFAGNDVLDAVAIDIDEIERVKLSELDAIFILARELVHEGVLLEGDLVALTNLLELGHTILMGLEAGDHIVEPVAVHVIDIHLRAALAEILRMLHPFGIALQ